MTAEEAATAPAGSLGRASSRWVLAAAILGSGIVFLDGTVVNVALPRIGRELPSQLLGTLEAQTYVYNGYLLTLSALLVAVAVYAALSHVPESRDEEARKGFDWIDAGLFALAVGGLSFGTIYGQQRDWRSPLGWLLVSVGVVSLVILPFKLRRSRHPLVPLELFRSRMFNTVNLSSIVIYGALYVTGYYLPLYLQGVIGFTAAAAGLIGLPGSLLMILLSPRAGRVASAFNNAVSRVGPQLAGALVFVGVSATFYSRLGAQPPGVSPLNRPLDAHWLEPALRASTDAFHLAMGLCVALLLAGAAISLFGAQRPRRPAPVSPNPPIRT